MAINVFPRRGDGATDPAQPIGIGEVDQEIYDCPGCGRPLAVEASRCPGCGVRLLVRTPLRRAAAFILVGAFVGATIGVSATVAAAALGDARPLNGGGLPGPTASAEPTAEPTDSATPATPAPTIPSIVASGLGQVALVNTRLDDAAIELSTTASAEVFDARATATVLRRIASEAAYGDSVVSRIATWPSAGELTARLAAFYALVRSTARVGLANSVSNAGAYRDAAAEMLAVLSSGLPDTDGWIRYFSDQQRIDLPGPAATPDAVDPRSVDVRG